MDQFPPGIPAWLAGAFGAWLILGIGVYLCLIRLVATRGGKVSVAAFGQPDFLLCAGFLVWFAMAITSGFKGPDKLVTEKELIRGGVLFVGIVGLIVIYLQYRGINPLRQFGLTRLNPLLCVAIAVGLLLCAMPLVGLIGKLTSIALNGKSHPQNLVKYFQNATETSDKSAVYLTMLLGVVVAPVAEETIFRGYIYGVLKRYLGPAAAAVIGAGMFAAMHLNASALPALFTLALCFTLAYEATGSLLVNIFMHSFFNLTMFITIMGAAHSAPAP